MYRSFTAAIVRFLAVVLVSISASAARAETKVACVGDSITALPTSWCGDLSTKLGAGYTVSNFGVSGTNLLKDIAQPYWTSTEFTPSHDFAPNIVIIMLGTNDSIPSTWSGKDHFVADYEDLIDSYTSLASHPTVYLILPTPIGTSPFGHSGDILADEVVPMVKQVAMNKGVTTIDAFTAFGGKDFEPGLYGDLDQVHPNDEGQQIICDLVYAALMSSDDPGNAGTGGSPGSGGSGNPGSGGMAGGGMGTGGSGNAGSGGMTGSSMGTGGASGGAGTMNPSGAGGGSATTAGNANTGGSASLAGAGGSANSSMVNAMAAAGTSAPASSAAESSGGGCRMAGNSTSQSGPAAVLLVLFAIAIRSRKRNVSIVQLLVVVQLFIVAGVANAQGMKVACVGDSITALPGGWCDYLGTKLGAGYTAQGFGVSGTTLLKDVGQPAYSSSDQYQPSHDFAPNIVVIMLGTNDSASRNWDAGKDHFVTDYEELIDSYTSLASKPMVFLNTPPPASDDNMFTISGTTIEKEINPLIKQVAMTKMCPLVDVWAAFDGDVEKIGSFDGVHPGDAGQMTIAETVYQAIQSPTVPGGNAGTGGSTGSGGSASPGSGGMAGGNVGTGGSGNAGSGGMAGGGANAGGAGGGSANAGSGGMASGSAGTGASASLAGAGGSANAGGNASSNVNAMAAAGTSASPGSAPESSGGGCRMAGNSTSKSGPAAVLLLLFAIAIRSRKRRERRALLLIALCAACSSGSDGSPGATVGSPATTGPILGSGGATAAAGSGGAGSSASAAAGNMAPASVPSSGAAGTKSMGAGTAGAAAAAGSGGAAGTPPAGTGGQGSDPGGTGTCTASTPVSTTASGTGSHQVIVETNSDSGIAAGTIFRPADLGGAEKYPIFAWGEGGCAQDGLSNAAVMGEIASHGYFVIADGTPNGTSSGSLGGDTVAMGKPLLAYIDWAIAENDKPCSAYYQSLDTTKIATNGFSCGGLMAEGTAGDPRITTWGLNSSGLFAADQALYMTVHTPVLIVLGGPDDIAYENGENDYDAISALNVPIMLFSKSGSNHGGDLFNGQGDFAKIDLAWLNWWLKGDETATGKGVLVGSSCTYCTDSTWEIKSKNLP